MSALSEKDFYALKEAGRAILEGRRKEHANKGARGKIHAVYIKLTPGKDDAPTPEVIVEKALANSNLAEAIFHLKESERYEAAISELNETTYEESN